jgi:hypothetical protein
MASPESVLKQLRSASPEARQAAIRYFVKSGVVPVEARADLVTLFESGPPWSLDLVALITRTPAPEFEGPFVKVLTEGGVAEQALALQYLKIWINSPEEPFARSLADKVDALRTAGDPWIAFLASLQAARHFGRGDAAWERAVDATLAGDQGGWRNSIRSQVEELVTAEEMVRLNEGLRARGAKPLGEPPVMPWKKW